MFHCVFYLFLSLIFPHPVSTCEPMSAQWLWKKHCKQTPFAGTYRGNLVEGCNCCGSVVAGYGRSSNFKSNGAIPQAHFETTSTSASFCVWGSAVRWVQNSEFFKLRSRLVCLVGRVTRSNVPGLPGKWQRMTKILSNGFKRILSISHSNLLDVLWSQYITIRRYEPFLSFLEPPAVRPSSWKLLKSFDCT